MYACCAAARSGSPAASSAVRIARTTGCVTEPAWPARRHTVATPQPTAADHEGEPRVRTAARGRAAPQPVPVTTGGARRPVTLPTWVNVVLMLTLFVSCGANRDASSDPSTPSSADIATQVVEQLQNDADASGTGLASTTSSPASRCPRWDCRPPDLSGAAARRRAGPACAPRTRYRPLPRQAPRRHRSPTGCHR
jgi:hypothetical protein